MKSIINYILCGICGLATAYLCYEFFWTENLVTMLSIENLNTKYFPFADLICYAIITIPLTATVFFYHEGKIAKESAYQQFRMMMIAACADGNVNDRELKVLKKAAIILGVSTDNLEQELDEIKKRLADGTLGFSFRPSEKKLYLDAYIKVIKADNILTSDEVGYLCGVANKMGISTEEINIIS